MLTEKFFVIAQVGHEITLWILILLSIFSVAFIIERYLTLSKIRKKSQKVSQQIQETLQSNSLAEVEEIDRDRESIEGRALAYGMRHIKAHGANGLEEVFNTYAVTEKPKLEKFLNYLATVGSNAPFIGLLGTVFGIMDAFRGLVSTQGDAAAVMIGISEALVATAVGLIVAIPAVIAYNYFSKQVRAIFLNVEGVRDLCMAYAKTLKGS